MVCMHVREGQHLSIQNYWFSELCPSSIILGKERTMFQEANPFLSLGEKVPVQIGSLERASLSP